MLLSSSRPPLSPMACQSDATENNSAAASTQRGQFLRRRAASQTKYSSSRIRKPAIAVAIVIVEEVTPASGVRSWNATDSASSISDRYSMTSNNKTFLGTFIWVRSLLGEIQSHFTIALGIVAPVFAHLDEQEQVHRNTDNLGDLLAGVRADRLDRGSALAKHDLALAVALDENGLLDPDRLVRALGPAVGLDRRLIWQFLVELPIDLFPGDLGSQMPHRGIRHLILGIVKRACRHHPGQCLAEIVHTIAGHRRNHEGFGKGHPVIG